MRIEKLVRTVGTIVLYTLICVGVGWLMYVLRGRLNVAVLGFFGFFVIAGLVALATILLKL